MINHTPGPWKVATYTEEDMQLDVIAGQETFVQGRVRAKWIANLDLESTECSFEELEANARLIASSPDLLDVLQMALELQGGWREAIVELEDFCSEPVRLKNMLAAADQLDEFAKRARAVLAKVTTGEPT